MVSEQKLAAPFITRVVLRNYKSIGLCDVQLGNLTFLVGPNGSGKSNFLDALRFVSDSVRFSLDHALRDRGGINEVRRRSRHGHPNHYGVRLEYKLRNGSFGYYAFEIAARTAGAYMVKQEECRIANGGPERVASYQVLQGRVVKSTLRQPPPAARDRLYLVNVSGFEEFREFYDAICQMGFYNLNPDAIRDLQTPDPGELLKRDGSNLASVFARLSDREPDLTRRIQEYLSKVVPAVSSVRTRTVGPKETLEFRQDVKGSERPWRFLASSMSDGTLRSFGLLVALFQAGPEDSRSVPLVGIEEPEIALHPAAAGVLTDSLRDASRIRQVLVTSHSPDLLDDKEVSDSSILAVISVDGDTRIGHLDVAGRAALREHLYTAGELLRLEQLRPHPDVLALRAEQLSLFGENG